MAGPHKSAIGSHLVRWTCRRCVILLILLLPLCKGIPSPLAAEPRFPLIISAGAHSLSVPWHMGPATKRLNPALIVGTERTLRPGGRVRLYQTANFGFFQHYWWVTGLSIGHRAGCRVRSPAWLSRRPTTRDRIHALLLAAGDPGAERRPVRPGDGLGKTVARGAALDPARVSRESRESPCRRAFRFHAVGGANAVYR